MKSSDIYFWLQIKNIIYLIAITFYRYRHNEDVVSHDLISTIDDDLVEFSSLNSTVNLYKENEENNSGNVHLILQPLTVPI